MTKIKQKDIINFKETHDHELNHCQYSIETFLGGTGTDDSLESISAAHIEGHNKLYAILKKIEDNIPLDQYTDEQQEDILSVVNSDYFPL